MNNLMNMLNNWMLHLGTWMQGATVGMGQCTSAGGSQNGLNKQQLWDGHELFPIDGFGEEIEVFEDWMWGKSPADSFPDDSDPITPGTPTYYARGEGDDDWMENSADSLLTDPIHADIEANIWHHPD